MMPTYMLISNIQDKLFKAEKDRIHKLKIELHNKNDAAIGTRSHGFIYRGERFYVYRASQRVALPSIVFALNKEATSFYNEYSTQVREEERTRQLLVQLFNGCITTQDFRDALPETLVVLVPEFKELPRHKEPAWTIQDNPRALREYNKLLPRIEMYSVTSMIY